MVKIQEDLIQNKKLKNRNKLRIIKKQKNKKIIKKNKKIKKEGVQRKKKKEVGKEVMKKNKNLMIFKNNKIFNKLIVIYIKRKQKQT